MRVLTVVPLYVPDSRVGAWLATHEFMRALVAAGHEVDVIPAHSVQRRYNVDRVRVWPSPEADRLMRRADIVVSHAGDNGHAHKAALRREIPSVRMVHGEPINVAALTGAALVVANSHATARSVGAQQPVVVCYPPTDPAKFKTTPGDRVTLVNLSAEKGGEVFWRLARVLPEVKFLGVRGGHGHQVAGAAPNVEVLAVTRKMRTEVYARTKVLLMPSSTETWGMTAVEAMVSGIPVLARRTPGLEECLGSAGNWVDSYDSGQWAAGVRSLLVPERWAAASERALARAAELDPADSRARFVSALEALL